MKKDFCVWQDEEVKALFKFVEIKKLEGEPLIKIFDEFAFKVGRQQNSVRNYYYNELKNLQNNKARANLLKIDLSIHCAKRAEHFSDVEEREIIKKIDDLINNGHSVRGACLNLADGDANKMIRFQNKYRLVKKIKNKEVEMGTVIKMPQQKNIMSEEDIKALFMGLVKLVKKQEAVRAKDEFENKISEANNKLKEALDEIIIKTQKIEKLQSEILLLKNEIEKNKENEIKRRVKFVQSATAKNLIKQFIATKQKQINVEQQALN